MKYHIFAIIMVLVPLSSMASDVYEFKGLKLGATLQEFKERYKRFIPDIVGYDEPLPLCSDQHYPRLGNNTNFSKNGLINCRITLRFEEMEGKSVTIAGVPTTSLIYNFVDNKLYGIDISFDHDGYDKVKEALTNKYDQP